MPKMWAVFDLDGVLCDARHREPLAMAKRWDEFHAACAYDPPHAAEIMMAQAWVAAGGVLAYNTGRSEPYRALTQLWMRQYLVPDGILLMREDGDHRPATVTKREQLMRLEADHLARGDQLVFIVEDADRLVTLWRELGYTCLQPRRGAF